MLTLLGALLTGLLAVWGSHLVSKRNARAADKSAEASVQQAINNGFTALTEGFTAQLDEAKQEITDLRGWIRELIQHIESLETLMRDHAPEIPLPARRTLPHPLAIVASNGETPRHG